MTLNVRPRRRIRRMRKGMIYDKDGLPNARGDGLRDFPAAVSGGDCDVYRVLPDVLAEERVTESLGRPRRVESQRREPRL